MTRIKGLYLAFALAFFALLSTQSFAQQSNSQPSQPIAPKSPLSPIIDQPDEVVSDTFSAKPDFSKPKELIPLKTQKPATSRGGRPSIAQQHGKTRSVEKKPHTAGTAPTK